MYRVVVPCVRNLSMTYNIIHTPPSLYIVARIMWMRLLYDAQKVGVGGVLLRIQREP